jgi:hypothetical protein
MSSLVLHYRDPDPFGADLGKVDDVREPSHQAAANVVRHHQPSSVAGSDLSKCFVLNGFGNSLSITIGLALDFGLRFVALSRAVMIG